jgi:phage baseplate assembly protein W
VSSLSDLYHYFGTDLSPSNRGDLLTVTAITRGQQRVLRRLLTNPGDYIFQPEYGAGLAQWIGANADLAAMRALIRGQMLLEPSVAVQPEPDVSVLPIANQAGGGFAVAISYTDAPSGEPVVLSFNVSN